MIERLKRLSFVASAYRAMHPYNTTCGCCGLPWAVVRIHFIDMVECTDEHSGSGFFPVCEYCWQHKSQEDIDKAVIKVHTMWVDDRYHGMIQNVPYELEDMLRETRKQRWKSLRQKSNKI